MGLTEKPAKTAQIGRKKKGGSREESLFEIFPDSFKRQEKVVQTMHASLPLDTRYGGGYEGITLKCLLGTADFSASTEGRAPKPSPLFPQRAFFFPRGRCQGD
jgi:hypothetical protein